MSLILRTKWLIGASAVLLAVILVAVVFIFNKGAEVKYVISPQALSVENFQLTSPKDGAKDVSPQVEFTWGKSKNALRYVLLISEDNDFSTLAFEIKDIVSNNYKMTTGLLNSKTYYWKVISVGGDNSAQAENSGLSFTTAAVKINAKEITIDDFEGYATDSDLRAKYSLNPSGDSMVLSLDKTFKKQGQYSMRIDYNLNNKFWANITKDQPMNLTGTNGIFLWVKPDGNSNQMTVDLTETGGQDWRAAFPLKGSDPYEVYVPFSKFILYDNTATDQKLDLNIIEKFVLAVSGNKSQGTIYVDDIKAYIGNYTDIVDDGAKLPVSSIIEDPNNYTSDSQVKAAYTLHPAGDPSTLSLSTMNGKKVLKWDYQLTKEYWTAFTKKQNLNISNSNGIEVTLVPDGNNNYFTIALTEQSGEVWKAKFKMSGTKKMVVKVPYSAFVRDAYPVENKKLDLDHIASVGYAVSGGKTKGTIYIDLVNTFTDNVSTIEVSGYQVPSVSDIDSFENYKNVDELRAQYQRSPGGDQITASLDTSSLYDGTNSMKIDYNINKLYWATLDSSVYMDLSSASGISFWIKPDGNNNNIMLIIGEADGETWRCSEKEEGTEPYIMYMPFNQFTVYTPDKVDGILDTHTIVSFDIAVSGSGSGTIYIDSIKALTQGDVNQMKSSAVNYINSIINSLPSPGIVTADNADGYRDSVNKALLAIKSSSYIGVTSQDLGAGQYDKLMAFQKVLGLFIDSFNSYTSDSDLSNAYSIISPTAQQNITLSLSTIANSGNSLKFAYSGIAASPYYVYIQKQFVAPVDMSTGLGVEMWVKPDGSGNAFGISLKDGNGNYYDYSDSKLLNQTTASTILIPFSAFKPKLSSTKVPIDLTSIVSISISVGKLNSDQGAIYVDDIKIYTQGQLDSEKQKSIEAAKEQMLLIPAGADILSGNAMSVQNDIEKAQTLILAARQCGAVDDDFGAQIMANFSDSVTAASRYIDTFEEYSDSSGLGSSYKIACPTTTQSITLSLDKSMVIDGSKLMKVNYSGLSYNPWYMGISKKLMPGTDFSSYSGIDVFVDPDGSKNKITFDFTDEQGRVWEYVSATALADQVPKTVQIPFGDFTLKQGTGTGTIDLAQMTDFAIYLGSSGYDTGVISIDDIKAYRDSELTGDTFRLDAPFTDNMVLQRNKPIVIWGYGKSNEKETVSFNGENANAVSGSDGKWQVSLPAMSAGGPYDLTVTGENNDCIKLTNIMMGEVWICSGQSNMMFKLMQLNPSAQELQSANNSNIRYFFQGENEQAQPAEQANNGFWVESTSDTAQYFSAVGYYFGKELQEDLHVPVGLIFASVGGTNIESWMSSDAYSGTYADKNVLYNGMIAPLTPMSIAGTIWYQGENNSAWPVTYQTLLTNMISDWRTNFKFSTMPFYIVQLPKYDLSYNWAFQREAQASVANSVSNTGLVVTIDGGDPNYIHPSADKADIGHRLALLARNKTYGEDILSDSPEYQSFSVTGNKIEVTFKDVGTGLKSVDGNNIEAFEIAGDDGVFYPADAVITGTDVITLSSPNVAAPEMARYAWGKSPDVNLVNSGDLPACPFRTYTYGDNGATQGFETFADDTALNAQYIVHPSGDKCTLSLDNTNIFGTGKSMKMDYTINNNGWCAAYTMVQEPFTGFDSLELYLKGDGSGRTFSISICEASGEVWQYTLTLDDTVPYELRIPFTDFKQVAAFGGNGIFEPEAISQIQYAISGVPGSGDVYIDNIRCVVASKCKPSLFKLTMPSNGGYCADLPEFKWTASSQADSYNLTVSENKDLSSPVIVKTGITTNSYTYNSSLNPDTTYYWKVTAVNSLGSVDASNSQSSFMTAPVTMDIDNFNSYADNTALNATYTTYGTGFSIGLDGVNKSEGTNGLKVTYGNTGWQYFEKPISVDFTPYDSLQFWVNPNNAGTDLIILLWEGKNGNSEVYYADYNLAGNKSGLVRIPFSSFIRHTYFAEQNDVLDKDSIVKISIGVNQSAVTSGSFYMDDIKLIKSDYLPGDFDIISPAAQASHVSQTPAFSWDASPRADSYSLVVSTNADLSAPIINVSGLTSPSFTPTQALSDNTYYWKVYAVNSYGETEVNGTVNTFIIGSKTVVIDDFESYADDTALNAAFTKSAGITLGLDSTNKNSGNYGLRVNYSNTGWQYVLKKITTGSLSGASTLQFWVKPNGTSVTLYVQLFETDNDVFQKQITLSGTAPELISIPITDFVCSSKPTATVDLSTVNAINFGLSSYSANVLYFDDILEMT